MSFPMWSIRHPFGHSSGEITRGNGVVLSRNLVKSLLRGKNVREADQVEMPSCSFSFSVMCSLWKLSLLWSGFHLQVEVFPEGVLGVEPGKHGPDLSRRAARLDQEDVASQRLSKR